MRRKLCLPEGNIAALAVLCILVLAALAGCKSSTGSSATEQFDAIDPTAVKWLRADPSRWTINASVDFEITSVDDSSRPKICWNATLPENWVPDSGSRKIGDLYILAKIYGLWQAAPIESIFAGQGRSSCTTMKNRNGQPPFIQAGVQPISTWYPKRGEQVGFLIATLPPASGKSRPLERTAIVLATYGADTAGGEGPDGSDGSNDGDGSDGGGGTPTGSSVNVGGTWVDAKNDITLHLRQKGTGLTTSGGKISGSYTWRGETRDFDSLTFVGQTYDKGIYGYDRNRMWFRVYLEGSNKLTGGWSPEGTEDDFSFEVVFLRR